VSTLRGQVHIDAIHYLKALGLNGSLPKWLPKKPLMLQVIASIDPKEANEILSSEVGEIGFWGQFLDVVTEREAKMHGSIEPNTVRDVLENLARTAREGQHELGRLTQSIIEQAYFDATGNTPDDAGLLMLSRLCTLGRVEPQSPDRQFVDSYIIQLLFASSLVNDITSKDYSVLDLDYRQPIAPVGLLFLAQWIDNFGAEFDAISFTLHKPNSKNSQAQAEIVVALLLFDSADLDFSHLRISGAEICIFDAGTRIFSNLRIEDCIIHELWLSNSRIAASNNVEVKNCELVKVTGLTAASAAPPWLSDCNIVETDNISNSARIKSTELPPSQKLFLSITHKIFFQSGGGRKESSLYKGGFGQQYDKKLIDKIIARLVSEGLVEKSKDSSGAIYNPRREFTSRMRAIREQLSLSRDELWLEIAKFS
jgi:hypothetical protein